MNKTDGAHGAPPAPKKPRQYRGVNSRSHAGDQPPLPRVETDMNPGDYVEVVSQTTLKEEEKLPGRMLKQWKASNDQDNFSTRVKQGPEVHSSAPVTRFMKENYRNIVLQRGPLTPMSRNPSNESMEVVPAAAWEDVSVDDSVDGWPKP